MRHAQDHWLRLQAERAVKAAEVETIEVEIVERWIQNRFDTTHKRKTAYMLRGLMNEHRSCIRDAARLLVRAERLHREITSLGGKLPK